jgi:hypothetical protein
VPWRKEVEKWASTIKEILTVAADVLENIGNYVPGYAGQGYQIKPALAGIRAGMIGSIQTAVAEYEENLVDFINDIRFDLSYPDLPFVVANTGIGGLSGKAIRMLWL